VESKLLEPFTSIARALNAYEARFLELMATMQYLSTQGLDLRQAGLRTRLLKPSQGYGEPELAMALRVLGELTRLVDGAA